MISRVCAGPEAIGDGPTTHDSQFIELARGNRNPVTWTELRDAAVPLFGILDRQALWHDPERLRSWTCQNVEDYWAGWLARARNLFSWPGLRMLGPAAPMWGVLGISRLHYTLATGRIASKMAAGEHALAAFDPRWQRIVGECLRIRRGGRGSLYRNPLQRRREALEFLEMAITAIRTRYCASE